MTSKYEYFNVTFPSPFVAHVEINRAKKMNAFSPPMWAELAAVFDKLSFDPEVRAIVLSGSGDRAFTSGLDVTAASSEGVWAGSSDPARAAVAWRRHIDELQESVNRVEKCEKPVIAVLHGIAFGLAIDLSCCCDVRIASADTRLSVREVDIGLAADLGTLSRLPYSGVSMSWIKDVSLTARIFSAEEALRVGFVSEVLPNKQATLDKAFEMAKLIAAKSPVAIQGTKEVINYSRDHTIVDGLNYIKVWNSAALQTMDVKDAMLSGLKKTQPKFSKL